MIQQEPATDNHTEPNDPRTEQDTRPSFGIMEQDTPTLFSKAQSPPATNLLTRRIPPPLQTDSQWRFKDRTGAVLARISQYRNRYRVEPGLYKIGTPDRSSPVFVSANYKLSFDILRSSLKNLHAYILVLDTRGINVWCAAGKGTFGTDEILRQIEKTALHNFIDHKELIVPQLGAPGVSKWKIRKESGYRIMFGPVYASDIPDYLERGKKATDEMRKIKFALRERAVLIPMEIRPSIKFLLIYIAAILFLLALSPEGFQLNNLATASTPYLFLGLAAILAGSAGTPLLLPCIPVRSFALKGWLLGLLTTAALFPLFRSLTAAPLPAAAALLFFPALSSYIALQFTGSSPYTGISGVKKEIKYSLPFYILATIASALLMIIHQFGIFHLS